MARISRGSPTRPATCCPCSRSSPLLPLGDFSGTTASLSNDELDARARRILDQHYAEELAEWRERFGTQRSNDLATSQLSEVARAATAAAVDELLFDINSTLEGSLDEIGALQIADEPGPRTYGVVDEIAARVLRSGGTVKAVRGEDLPDADTLVAALLRFPV